jgi:hypothetical protein
VATDLKKLRDELLAEQLQDVAPAQDYADKQGSIAGWGRVANSLSSAFGAKPSNAVYDGIDQRGQRAVADATARAGMKQAATAEARTIGASQDAAAKDAKENDPNSPSSVTDAEFAGKLTGQPDVFKGMSTAQIHKAAPFLKEFLDQKKSERESAAKLEAEGRTNSEWDRRNKTTSSQEDERARIAAANKSDTKAADDAKKATEGLETDVQKYAGKLPEGAAGFYEQSAQIHKILDKYKGKDVPGVGGFDSKFPQIGAAVAGQDPKDALDMQKYAQQMMLAYQKLVTGTGGSNEEMNKIRQAGADLGNEKSFTRGLQALENGYDAYLKQIQAGYRPEVIDTYNKRNPAFTKTGGAGAPETKNINGKTYEKRNGKWFEVGNARP